jgi:hypothetical protein
MLGVGIASVLIRGPMPLQAGVGVGFAMLAGLLLIGCWYAELRLWRAGVMALVPLTAWIAWIPALRARSRWGAGALAALLAVIVTAAIIMPAVRQAQRQAEADPYASFGK